MRSLASVSCGNKNANNPMHVLSLTNRDSIFSQQKYFRRLFYIYIYDILYNIFILKVAQNMKRSEIRFFN